MVMDTMDLMDLDTTLAGHTGNGSLDTLTPTPGVGEAMVNGSSGQHNGSYHPSMGPLLYQYVYVTMVTVLVFVVGVTGNILVIQVVVRNRPMWKRINFFLVSLSCADLQLLIVGLPVAVLEFYSKERWYIGEEMCRMVFFLENASHHCSVMTLLVIGFERYYAICHPLRETAGSQLTSPYLLIPTTWILSCVVSLPMAFFSRIVPATFYDGSDVELCRFDVSSNLLSTYIIFIFSVFLVLPLLLLTSMYTMIILTLENSTKYSNSISNGSFSATNSERRRCRSKDNDNYNSRMISSRRQVIRMMVAVMALYFLCLMPMRIVQIWLLLASPSKIDSLGLEGSLNLVYSVRVLIYLNCAGNPIIYGLISANFRSAFKQSMTCCSHKMDGHRYNIAYYHNNKHRSVNYPVGTPTDMTPSRIPLTSNKQLGANLPPLRGGGKGGGQAPPLVNNKSNKKVKVVVENDKHSVMSTEVVNGLYDRVDAANQKDDKTKKGTFV